MAKKSLLVVEDDPDIRDALLQMLVVEGYNVRACANGLEALERLRTTDLPDLIVLDLMMPVMDGWQFRLHQRADPRLAPIPVLAISADTTPKAAAIDAEAYLRKPVDYDALLATIERTLVDMERRRLHAAQSETERLAALGTLAAGVAHEINNPLAFVIANLEFVARSVPEGEARAALDEARGGCARIRDIVRDLQLLSRSSDEAPKPIDVRKVLDSSANVAANEVSQRARLVKEYRDAPLVRANETRLGQVLLNLVLNAAQAIDEGNALANEVRLVVRTDAAGWAVVEVHDTGKGIPAAIQGRIFEPFFTTKPVGVGTGLGLSIAHRLVTAMGGQLTATSEAGRGATFRVRLPPAPPVSATITSAAPTVAPPRVRPAELPRAKILVIDDEEAIGTMIERVLSDVHDVEATTDADGAIAGVRTGARYDLILCDVMMPARNGIDVYAAIEEIDPAQAARMLFLTGGAFSPRAKQFLATRSDRVVDKPFVVGELLAKIDSMLAMTKGRG